MSLLLAFFAGASLMWLYLRFTKLIRNREEHARALTEETYHPKNSHGLVGAIYHADTTDFKKFVKGYFQYQKDICKDLLQVKGVRSK